MATVRGASAIGHLLYTGQTGLIPGYAKAKRGYRVPSDFIAALIPGMILHLICNAALRDEELWGFRPRAPVE